MICQPDDLPSDSAHVELNREEPYARRLERSRDHVNSALDSSDYQYTMGIDCLVEVCRNNSFANENIFIGFSLIMPFINCMFRTV